MTGPDLRPCTVTHGTAGEVQHESLPAWEAAISRCLTPVEVTAVGQQKFRGRLDVHSLDRLRLIRIAAAPHRLSRATTIGGDPCYHLVVPVDGHVTVDQDARSAPVGPGHLAVQDTTRRFHLRLDETATLLVVAAPHRAVGIPPLLVRYLTGAAIGLPAGLSSMIGPTLLHMIEGWAGYHPHHSARLAHNLADLLTTLLLEHLHAVLPNGSIGRLILELTTYVDEHLGDTGLSTESIAAALYISPRYLRRQFEDQQHTLSEWIRLRRLDRCRHELVDPLTAAEPISAIAARWGFPNAAHFSRLYRAAYGRSPRDQRRDAGAGPEQRPHPGVASHPHPGRRTR